MNQGSDNRNDRLCISLKSRLAVNDSFVARSQAKKLLADLDRYQGIILDFEGIDIIGQGFADEIFRVFKSDHPNIEIIPLEANENVMLMIMHVLRPANPR